MTKPISRKMAVDSLLYRFVLVTGEYLPCAVCGEPLKPGDDVQFDHAHSDVMGGAHEFQNLRPVHYDPCHKKKTKADIQANAKVKRIVCGGRKKRGPKIKSRGFDKKLTKTFGGKVRLRND